MSIRPVQTIRKVARRIAWAALVAGLAGPANARAAEPAVAPSGSAVQYRLSRVLPVLPQPWYGSPQTLYSSGDGRIRTCGFQFQVLTDQGFVVRTRPTFGSQQSCWGVDGKGNLFVYRQVDGSASPYLVDRLRASDLAVDATIDELAAIGGSGSMCGPLRDGGFAYSASGLRIVDPATSTVVRTVPLPPGCPVELPDGRFLLDTKVYSATGVHVADFNYPFPAKDFSLSSFVTKLRFIGGDGKLYQFVPKFQPSGAHGFLVHRFDATTLSLEAAFPLAMDGFFTTFDKFQPAVLADGTIVVPHASGFQADRSYAYATDAPIPTGIVRYGPDGVRIADYSPVVRDEAVVGLVRGIFSSRTGDPYVWSAEETELVRIDADGAITGRVPLGTDADEIDTVAGVVEAFDGRRWIAVTYEDPATAPHCTGSAGCVLQVDAGGAVSGTIATGREPQIAGRIDVPLVVVLDVVTSSGAKLRARSFQPAGPTPEWLVRPVGARPGEADADGAPVDTWHAAIDAGGKLVLAEYDGSAVRLTRFEPSGSPLGVRSFAHGVPDLPLGSGLGELGSDMRSVGGFEIGPGGELIVAFDYSLRVPCIRFEPCPQPPYSLLPTSSVLRVYAADGTPLMPVPQRGFLPGQSVGDDGFRTGGSVAVDSSGDVLFAEARAGRFARYALAPAPRAARALVVAGGGPYAGNSLWDATEASASAAFRALAFQGFDKDTVQFLSPSVDNDIDNNGVADDVDAAPSAASLEAAITGAFAAGAEDLVVYLVDHGGPGTFRLSPTELMTATQLDGWLDTWQAAHPTGRVVVVIDSCASGSFVEPLAAPRRVVVTSAAAGEDARFLYNGSLSFSASFFSEVVGGGDLGAAFSSAAQVIRDTFPAGSTTSQTPQLDADGDGVANEAADTTAAATYVIGSVATEGVLRPVVGSVTAPSVIGSGSTATITASGVASAVGIRRVWMVLQEPGLALPNVKPVADLPAVDLERTAEGEYAITHDGFARPGTWRVSVFAQDSEGVLSRPVVRAVTVQDPLVRKAVLAVLAAPGDARRRAFRAASGAAEAALRQQGYGPDGTMCNSTGCDAMFVLRDDVSADAPPTLANVGAAITVFAADGAQDAIVHLVGTRVAGGLRVGTADVLTPAQLDAWLDTLQSTLPGPVTVIVDADDANAFIAGLSPPAGKRRIVISSTSPGETALFSFDGAQSYSSAFFARAADGASFNTAHTVARDVVSFPSLKPRARLDDNGNGVGGDTLDGAFARRVQAGNGLLLAGDPPFASGVSIATSLSGQDATPITVTGAQGTNGVARVRALLRTPANVDIPFDLGPTGTTTWAGTIECLGSQVGAYELLVHAIDASGELSAPLTAQVSQAQLSGTTCAALDRHFADGFE